MEKFYIHADGFIYHGDMTPGAREATQEEIAAHLQPVKTPEEIQKSLTDAVQKHMDLVAQQRGYDNIFSAATYADEPTVTKFQAEGQAYRAWRSAVWAHCYSVLKDVKDGMRNVPAVEELIAGLPVLQLPE